MTILCLPGQPFRIARYKSAGELGRLPGGEQCGNRFNAAKNAFDRAESFKSHRPPAFACYLYSRKLDNTPFCRVSECAGLVLCPGRKFGGVFDWFDQTGIVKADEPFF